jgi:transglutaminase-like putative cysteine protease
MRLPWRHWTPATRELRDTLFMLALISWTLAPHLLRVSPWVALMCVGVLAWRTRLAWTQGPLPGRWVLLLVLLVAAGLTWATQRTLLGRDAGVSLLVVLMTLKTLELRARRDALVVFFLGFFLVLTHFLFSQSLLTALAMGVSVWGWLTALTLAHMPAGRPTLRHAASLAGRAALWGTPVMVALFLLFPRIGPLWAMPGAEARTGLSDQLRLGSVAELAQDDSVALRLRFASGQRPAPDQLYLRGPVLSDYDGEQWRSPRRADLPLPLRRSAQVSKRGEPITYEMTLEPLRIPWLPLLEVAADTPLLTPALQDTPVAPDAGGSFRLRAPVAQRLRLTAQAWPQARRDVDLPLLAQRDLVELPAGHHARTLAWAAQFHRRADLQSADARTLAAAVLAYIRSEPYRYTLSPGLDEGDPIDSFWLDRRSGFCEHFATAFVVVMRALDVPARVVTGYQGSDPDVADGYLVVRQSNAHAWAEFWQPGEGWVRADPTAAVAPERVERGQRLRNPPGLVLGAMDAVNPALRLQLRQWFEQLDNRWNQWVLGYGKQQQFNLMERLGMGSPDWQSLAQVLLGLLTATGLAGAVWAWYDGRRQTPWQHKQARVLKALTQVNVEAGLQDAPRTLARRLAARHGPAARALCELLLEWEQARYGPPGRGAAATAWWPRFRRTHTLLKRQLGKG